MFKKVVGLAGCLRGKHVRDKDKIRRVDDTFVSRCLHCGVKLRRRSKRDWVVDRRARS